MEHYFFILCIVCFVLFVWLAQYIFSYIGREISLYRMYSKNGELRALMAKDARRFHISIVYLMTYMARSDGDDVQFDKLKMILRYIREVCPQEWQVDAVEALKYLTDRGLTKDIVSEFNTCFRYLYGHGFDFQPNPI